MNKDQKIGDKKQGLDLNDFHFLREKNGVEISLHLSTRDKIPRVSYYLLLPALLNWFKQVCQSSMHSILNFSPDQPIRNSMYQS